jgi:hypothetical protein
MTKTPAELLDAAADAIDVHGWRTGEYGSTETGFCAYGSIRYAAFGALMGLDPNGITALGNTPESVVSTATPEGRELVESWSNANLALVTHVIENHPDGAGAWGVEVSVPWWNDHMAGGAGEVTDALRTAAKILREDT